MLIGDATLQKEGSAHKVCHRCMPTSGDNSNINCGAPDAQTLPTGMCVGGIRSVITFPTCWDGVNLDSPDHVRIISSFLSSFPPTHFQILEGLFFPPLSKFFLMGCN